jgi:hypothetical protein
MEIFSPGHYETKAPVSLHGADGATAVIRTQAFDSPDSHWVYLLAYNLIRILMAQAALLTDILPRQLSFKHTLQLWIGWRWSGNGSNDHEKLHELFILIAQQRVGNQPGRVEPRAIKRRHKPFLLQTKPRQLAREEIRLYGHPKKLN